MQAKTITFLQGLIFASTVERRVFRNLFFPRLSMLFFFTLPHPQPGKTNRDAQTIVPSQDFRTAAC